MLTKIYIDNFRSLVNFEFEPGPVCLILGANGSGKSTLLEALWRLREVLVGGHSVYMVFQKTSLTRWESRTVQTFEATVDGNGGRYVYRLEIEQHTGFRSAEIAIEALYFDGNPLFLFKNGEVTLYRDDHSEGPKYPSDEGRSGLSNVPSRPDFTKLSWFKDWMSSLCLAIVGSEMELSSREPSPRPDLRLANFASWYRHLLDKDFSAVQNLTEALRAGVIEGFEAMLLVKESESSHKLWVELKVGSEHGAESTPRFADWELSDGQRVLIKLYALAFCAMKPDTTLFLDDPVTDVGLAEIQPWLTALLARADDIGAQVLLTSHHPELINYLARDHGVVFYREGNGPTRVKPAQLDDGSGLPPSELIARGWVDG
jgi:ABC-type transport system involved in cytochrome c biogenesis ATPase subunit